MLLSMTGFGDARLETEDVTVRVEIRAGQQSSSEALLSRSRRLRRVSKQDWKHSFGRTSAGEPSS